MDTNSSQEKNTKNSKTDQMILDWIEKTDKLQEKYFALLKKLFKKIGHFIPIIIGYTFMAWIFTGMMDTIGFEKTLIILLAGVFYYGLRNQK